MLVEIELWINLGYSFFLVFFGGREILFFLEMGLRVGTGVDSNILVSCFFLKVIGYWLFLGWNRNIFNVMLCL